MSFDVAAMLAGLVTTLLSGLLTSLLKQHEAVILRVLKIAASLLEPSEETSSGSPLPTTEKKRDSSEAEKGLLIRLREVREALLKQNLLAVAYRVANGLLVIGQFIIGGLLASSFLQEQLTKEIVGALGVLVLLSSLLRQHFRPEVQVVGCRQRAAILKSLLRQAEDMRFSRLEGDGNAPSISEIRQLLSNGLRSVEESEVLEIELLNGREVGKPKSQQSRSRAAKRLNKSNTALAKSEKSTVASPDDTSA